MAASKIVLTILKPKTMATKTNEKKNESTATVDEETKKALDAYGQYVRLSKLLFYGGEQCPMDINELKKDNEFYGLAKEICDELEIDWKKMTHEESNRIMLAMLEDTYQSMREDCPEDSFIISYSIKKKDPNETKG